MKQAILAVMLIFTFALLMGGSCGPKEEPIPEEPTVSPEDTMTTPEPEPEVETPPEPEALESGDFQKVYFDFDKSNIRPDAARALEYNAELLKQNPGVDIIIEGHCDERGTVEYNLALGERRANSAKDYLVSLGVDGNRMETISYGKERPVALGHNEEAWQLNRRCEFVVQE
ncbi:MAG TPA: peptidoglycan-associated lipoprotein Pal [candidate division Zixibacteria bacterium]|nr:peptidoglycan-associated lipoprotein Pal [candidate division Zixibacteria bacterium]